MCFKRKKKVTPTPEKATKSVKKEPVGAPNKPEAVKEKATYRVYHVSKRSSDQKWQVKYRTGEKAIKLFNTQAEAVEYASELAHNQNGGYVVHASKGAHKGRIKSK